MTKDEMIEKQISMAAKVTKAYAAALVSTENNSSQGEEVIRYDIRRTALSGLQREVELLRFLREEQMKAYQGT